MEFKAPDRNLHGEFIEAAKDVYPLLEDLPIQTNIEIFHVEVNVFLCACYVQKPEFQ